MQGNREKYTIFINSILKKTGVLDPQKIKRKLE